MTEQDAGKVFWSNHLSAENFDAAERLDKTWILIYMGIDPTGSTKDEKEEVLKATLGLLNSGYSPKQAAALILAAPELLDISKKILRGVQDESYFAGEVLPYRLPPFIEEKLEAAIAKAKGEQ